VVIQGETKLFKSRRELVLWERDGEREAGRDGEREGERGTDVGPEVIRYIRGLLLQVARISSFRPEEADSAVTVW
jgi:hypothetical protein